MNIVFTSSEVYPFSKTGGLADVVGALPEALVKLGHQVTVISPWYQTLKANPQPLWIGDEWIPFDGGISICGVGTLERNGVLYAFISHDVFKRPALYGYNDDAKRFSLFTRAIPQVTARLSIKPDVFHAHDWHTAYLPMLLEHGWHMPESLAHTPSVFTIHNIQYQGNSGLDETLYWLRLPSSLKDGYMNYFGGANAMQAALGFAHKVTTVSPTYAEEIKSVEYGYGLDATMRYISAKLEGILNGIDTELWNPATDTYLPKPYDAKTLEHKQLSKQELCSRFNLDESKPILGVVSRLADQKGIDFLVAAIPGLLWQDWNVMVLGAGDTALEDSVRYYTTTNPGRVGNYIGYDEGFAHLIYAGADALAIPSRFEPCGLTQMIAMRYGTLSIARDTGGLHDSIIHDQTGFLFNSASPEGLLWATGVARGVYAQPELWQERQRLAMQQNFSWEVSAKKYVEMYQSLVKQ